MLITVRDVCCWSKFHSFTTPKHAYNYNYNSSKFPNYSSISICRSSLSVNPKPNFDLHSNSCKTAVFDPLGISSGKSLGLSSAWDSFIGLFESSSSTKRDKPLPRGVAAAIEDTSIDFGDFFKGPLPGKFLKLLGFLALSRLGIYIPLGGVNREAFTGSLDQNSILTTLDTFSGGGIGRLGICSLGIVPFINASIVFQLLTQLYPKLQDLQKREGEAGRKKILQYTRYASVGFAIVQVPYYLAELTEKTVDGDRLQIIKASLVKLKEFISFCEAMELVPEEELEACKTGGPNSNVDQRAKKIARFKRQRAAESKLLDIKERKERRMRSTRAAALSTPAEAGEEDALDYDVEEEREAWLITISLDICKAFDLIEMLRKEEEMLTAIKEKQSQEGNEEISQAVLDERAKTAEAWHRRAAARAQYTKPAAPITCATFAQDVLEGRAQVSQAHEHKHQQPLIFGPTSLVGGRVTSERERMAAQVFQPGHRLPTMSIEEAGLREMEMMNNWQERTAKMMAEANSSWYNDDQKPKPGEEEDEDDDAAQDKARAWDDWKDENPRGAGNKKLTPCG